jgi:translation initiation factor 2 alpha subunit (eIF-2alpha)
LNEVKRRFKTSILKTMAEFSVEIKTYEGVHAIKRILQGGVDAAKQQNYEVKVSIIGAPKYTCFV